MKNGGELIAFPVLSDSDWRCIDVYHLLDQISCSHLSSGAWCSAVPVDDQSQAVIAASSTPQR
jgi:hypothetical protein